MASVVQRGVTAIQKHPLQSQDEAYPPQFHLTMYLTHQITKVFTKKTHQTECNRAKSIRKKSSCTSACQTFPGWGSAWAWNSTRNSGVFQSRPPAFSARRGSPCPCRIFPRIFCIWVSPVAPCSTEILITIWQCCNATSTPSLWRRDEINMASSKGCQLCFERILFYWCVISVQCVLPIIKLRQPLIINGDFYKAD